MKSGRYVEIGVLCPYYKYSTACSVSCESFIPLSAIHTTFAGRDIKNEFKRKFCCTKKWDECPLAQIRREEKY